MSRSRRRGLSAVRRGQLYHKILAGAYLDLFVLLSAWIVILLGSEFERLRHSSGYGSGPGAFLRSLSRSTIRPLVVTAIAAIVILTYSHTSRSATALPGSFAAVSSDLQAESAGAFTPAVDFVKTYYRLSNERDFQMMYGMLSERMQRKNPFADYVKYYDFVQHIAVEATPGDTANAVNVRITTRYRENNGTVTQSVDEGRWLLDVQNGGLRLNAEDVHQIK